MNSIMKNYFPVFEMYQAPRNQLMELLTDEDLAFRLEGGNPTLGVLRREMGEVEYSYIQSFKIFEQDLSYRNEEPGLEVRVEKLTSWFEELDNELRATVEGLSEEDIQNRVIDRSGDFTLPPQVQLEV